MTAYVWPPRRKKRTKRRHCARTGGGHRAERHIDGRGRLVTACVLCGADVDEIYHSNKLKN